MTPVRSKCRAFTLVELLVVIGIIAVLIGVLLPVLSKVQGKGRDIKCQANLRQIVTALLGYAQENRGVFPYGHHWTVTVRPIPQATNVGHLQQSGGGPQNFVCWASQIGKWLHKGKMVSSFENEVFNFSEILKCPEAQLVWPHPISYVMNMVVGVRPTLEFAAGTLPNAQLKPPHLTLMLKDTVLVWDSCVFDGLDMDVGFLVGADIDGQRFWEGASNPWQRYYSQRDPYADPNIDGGIYGYNQPVRMAPLGFTYQNIDPKAAANMIPYQGNLRFRHQSNTACNAGFVDGHVEAFVAKLGPNKTVISHNALRRYFMVKPPNTARFPEIF
jgi:prepilin-type N-terminal cleavage/methylation domain-containing protein/prepilin-type processing-associated H-X9-DG protein